METSKTKEQNIAFAWHIGNYTQEQAKLSCDIQKLSFQAVLDEYSYLYELDQRAGALKWN